MSVSFKPIALLASLIVIGAVDAEPKIPLPAEADVTKAEKQIKEIFKAEYAKTKIADQNKLAELLFKEAEETKNDPPSVYALLRESQHLALQANNLELAAQATETLITQFEVDSVAIRKALFEELVKRASTRDAAANALRAVLAAKQQAMAADQLDAAAEFQKLAETIARKTQHVPTITNVVQGGKDLTAMRAEYEKYKPALAGLADKPDDPALNLTVGRYLCFVKADWEKGLAHLRKCDDAIFKDLAEKEMAAPDKSNLQLALADTWYELIAKQDGLARKQIQRRAHHWYEKAAEDLKGLNKQRALKRMEELAAATSSEGNSAGSIHEYVRQAVRRNKIDANTPAHGGFFAEREFKWMAPEGGILIGFNLATSKFGGNIDYISSLQPIYRVASGEKLGPTFGKSLPPKFTTLKAKEGFAVGKIHVIDGGNLDQFSLTFMKVRDTGLDANGSYQSAVVGTKLDKNVENLDGKGQPIVGLHGKESGGGSILIGIVIPVVESTQPKKKSPPK
jgi:hypothetical protein